MSAPKPVVEAVRGLLTPDPYLGDPHEDTVQAIAEFVVLVCCVSNARRPSLAEEPWRGKDATRHLDHAGCHVMRAIGVAVDKGEVSLDAETGCHDAAHAGLRLAFALWRQIHGKGIG